ncbi:MAG: hypothetical protein K2I91_05760, partial [Muribaculaceae bacterium]|nr:hypothetical protein [Muribaculaceae bacterium]
MLSACSNTDTPAHAEALLLTVPADPAYVQVLDIDRFIDNNGGKADGSVVKNDERLRKELVTAFPKFDIASLLDGEAGISFTAAVVFADNLQNYLTFRVEDGEKFRAYTSAKAGLKWTQRDKLYTADSLAQSGNQVWLCSKGNFDRISEYASLTKARSFMSNEYAATLSACEHDIAYYIPVSAAIDASSMSFSERASLRMALSMVFDNVVAVAGYADAKDKKVEVTADMLDSNGRIAKCNLKLGKIDVAQTAALGGNANTIFAISLPHQLIDQLLKTAESLGGTMPALYKNLLTPLDGTVALATSVTTDMDKTDVPFIASIATTGNQAPLMQSLYGMGLKPVSEGNLLKISVGNYGAGALKVADAAKE